MTQIFWLFTFTSISRCFYRKLLKNEEREQPNGFVWRFSISMVSQVSVFFVFSEQVIESLKRFLQKHSKNYSLLQIVLWEWCCLWPNYKRRSIFFPPFDQLLDLTNIILWKWFCVIYSKTIVCVTGVTEFSHWYLQVFWPLTESKNYFLHCLHVCFSLFNNGKRAVSPT